MIELLYGFAWGLIIGHVVAYVVMREREYRLQLRLWRDGGGYIANTAMPTVTELRRPDWMTEEDA